MWSAPNELVRMVYYALTTDALLCTLLINDVYTFEELDYVGSTPPELVVYFEHYSAGSFA